MRQVEDALAYQCRAYFDDDDLPSSCSSSLREEEKAEAANVECRTKVIDWTFSIVEFCGFDRDTVFVATSFADRFLSLRTEEARHYLRDRKRFQLLFLTSLHVAVKVREQASMDCPLLSRLSRGTYEAHEFVDCERMLLHGLDWRVNGPTTMDFVHTLMLLLPKDGVGPSVAGEILERARKQSRLAATNSKVLVTKQSVVALAAVYNAVETISLCELPSRQRSGFLRAVEEATDNDFAHESVTEARVWLWEISNAAFCSHPLRQNEEIHPGKDISDVQAKGVTEGAKIISPVCISRLSVSRNRSY